MQKYSILGCILMVTSAITAAFIPNTSSTGSKTRQPLYNGHMTLSTFRGIGNPDITCREILVAEYVARNCSWTETRDFDLFDYLSSTSKPGDMDSISFRNEQETGTYTTSPALEDDFI